MLFVDILGIEWGDLFQVWHVELTSVSLWKMTTRPPLSPVASRSPVWLNSTVEMTSAGRATGKCEAIKQDNGRNKRSRDEGEKDKEMIEEKGN